MRPRNRPPQRGGQRQGETQRNAPLGWRTRFPLPNDVAQVLGNQRNKCDNLGLWLDRFVDWTDQDERGRGVDLQPNMTTKKRQAPMLKKGRDGALEMQSAGRLVEACQGRLRQQRASYEQQNYHVQEFTAHPDYRLVVGFGAEHVLETSLCLHRIYGFPIIPGSAVKGVTRAWAYWEIANKLGVPAASAEEAERRKKADLKTPLQLLDQLLSQGDQRQQEDTLKRLQQDRLGLEVETIQALDIPSWRTQAGDFYRTFGTTRRQGQVIFFDAYPTQAPRVELDILNPHYGDYYSQKTDRHGNPVPPADYLNPVPTYFLTVSRRTFFQFALASKDPTLAQKAREWLTGALSELGIGGKTSSGYGFMEVR